MPLIKILFLFLALAANAGPLRDVRDALERCDIASLIEAVPRWTPAHIDEALVDQLSEFAIESGSEDLELAVALLLERSWTSFDNPEKMNSFFQNARSREARAAAGMALVRKQKAHDIRVETFNQILELEINRSLVVKILDRLRSRLMPGLIRWDLVAARLKEGPGQRELILRSMATAKYSRVRPILQKRLLPLIRDESARWGKVSAMLLKQVASARPKCVNAEGLID